MYVNYTNMYTDNNRSKNGSTKEELVTKKRRKESQLFLAGYFSYRCWKFNFLMQMAYMNAKNTGKSTRTGATTAIKLLWYPK
jgi:hypothetical protein